MITNLTKQQYLLNQIFMLIALVNIASTLHAKETRSEVQLAKVYNNERISAYLVSEKYDGIRAIWQNNELRTRTGNLIHAPDWFTKDLPDVWLDGELWRKRNDFEYVASTVTKSTPVDAQWRHIKYMVFDAPNSHQPFRIRAKFYTSLITSINSPYIKAVSQFRVQDKAQLIALLDNYTENGAEGLMLQQADALFVNGRNSNLLKLKKYMDAEAIVVKHLPGKGKYTGKMGSLLVEFTHQDGSSVQFKIGSGFSDSERVTPPAIGAIVTFSYHGFSKRGLPKFASYIRERVL